MDARIRFDQNRLVGDLNVEEGDLGIDDGLETAVNWSLFTDARAGEDDEIPDGTTNRRGWWADSISEIEGDVQGSKLWLLEREKATQETLNRAQEYATIALAWMVEDGVASSIVVTTERITRDGTNILGLLVQIYRGSQLSFEGRYEPFWRAQVA